MLLHYFAILCCVSIVSLTELYDVTTIYRFDEPSGGIENDTNPVLVEIHGRTNALGLPFLAGGSIAEPSIGIDIPRCEALYLNSVTCDWELDNFEWGSHTEAPLIDTGEWTEFHVTQSSSRFYYFNDILFIKFSGLIQSHAYINIVLGSTTGFLQEHEEFYFIQLSQYFGRFLHRCDNRVFDRHYRFKDLDGEIISAYCQRVATFDSNNKWTYDAVTKNYLIIEIKQGRIQVWDSKAKSKPVVSWVDSDPVKVSFFTLRGDGTGNSQIVAYNYGKGQVLSMSENAKVGSITSPWITLNTDKVCLSVVYYSKASNTPTVLSVTGESGHTAELGVLKTETDGWKVERLVLSGPIGEDDLVQISLRSLKNEGLLEIQRIAGCNVEDDEDIAIVTDARAARDRFPYNVAVKTAEDKDKTDDFVRDDCENGGLGFGPNLCACPAGFTGDRCQIGCGANRYGSDCKGLCSVRSQGCGYLTLCTPVVGCLCAPGFKGYYCNMTCDTQEYGAGCDQRCNNCEGNCDRFTGACNSYCLPGFYPPYCKKFYSYTRFAPDVNASNFGEAIVTPDILNHKGEGSPAFFQIQFKLVQDLVWTIHSTHSVPEPEEKVPDILIQGLDYGQTYQVRIVLIDSDLNSYQGDLIPYTEFLSKCSVPEEVNYDISWMASETNIVIIWRFDVNDPYMCPVVSYELSWQEGWRWISHNVSTTSAELLNKLPGTEYKVKVRALTTGEYAPYSDIISVKTKKEVPDPVTDLHLISAEHDSLILEWTASEDIENYTLTYIVSYECLRRAACDTPCNSSGEAYVSNTNITLNGLEPLTQYIISVIVSGKEQSENTSILVATKQNVPYELPVESTVKPRRSNTSATVYWEVDTVCSGFLLGFNYELFVANGPQAIINSGFTKNNNATFEDLSPVTRYIVHVYVLTSGGWNPQNFLEIYVTTRANVPSRVQDLTVYKKSRYMLGIRWAEPNMTYGELNSFTITYNINNSEKTMHVLPKHCIIWPELYCYDIQDLLPDQLYTVSVSARNTEISADGEAATVTGYTKETAPELPENLQVINVTSNSAVIQWDHPRYANGLIRSFLLSVEETEHFDWGLCCKLFPVTEIPVKEEEHYQIELKGLYPASTYTLSISGKTVLIGSGESLVVHTKPPHSEVKLLPSVTTVTQEQDPASLTWLPQQSSFITNNSQIYSQLLKSYIFLLVVENEPPSFESSGIEDENLYNELAAVFNCKISAIVSYDRNDLLKISSHHREEVMISVVSSQLKLAAVQVLEYHGVYSTDVVLSSTFSIIDSDSSFLYFTFESNEVHGLLENSTNEPSSFTCQCQNESPKLTFDLI